MEWSCAVGLNGIKCLIFLRLTKSSTQIIQQKINKNCGYDIVQLSETHPTVQNEHNPLCWGKKSEFVVQKSSTFFDNRIIYTKVKQRRDHDSLWCLGTVVSSALLLVYFIIVTWLWTAFLFLIKKRVKLAYFITQLRHKYHNLCS